MVPWINRHQRALQWLVAAAALVATLMVVAGAWRHGLSGDPEGRAFKGAVKSVAKPAELAFFAVVGLFVVRVLFPHLPAGVKELGRSLLRFLQVLHIPLAIVLLVGAAAHGLVVLLLHWQGDFHDWSGLVALVGLVPVALLGWRTVGRRHTKRVHLTVGLSVAAMIVIHIMTV